MTRLERWSYRPRKGACKETKVIVAIQPLPARLLVVAHKLGKLYGPAMEEGPLLQICDGRDVKWDHL
jgi:hypothetical protein